MVQANIHEAKTQLSKLIERAEAGEEVIIARHGKPVARIQAFRPTPRANPWIGMFDDRGDVGGISWQEWKALDREIEQDFEDSIYAPEPGRRHHPELPSEERNRINGLSTDELYRELMSSK